MEWFHVRLWHTLIQPLINSRFQHWHLDLPPQDARADVGWNWTVNFALAMLHNTATYIPGNQSSRALALAIVVTTTKGDEIPIGMLTVVPQFHCNIENTGMDCTFAWYLADAPKAFYTEVLGVNPVKGVASALLDSAIQAGFDAACDGATLLHADPHGGKRLTDFYVQRCSMRQLTLARKPISLFRRSHSNQYFFMDAHAAKLFCQQFNERR